MAADQDAEVRSADCRSHVVVPLVERDGARDPERRERPLEERACGGRLAALVRRRCRCGRRALDRRDDACGRVADAEETALALADDLEANGLAVDAGGAVLELAERGPLRLADGLARRLDGDLVGHRRLPPPLRFRFTRRGGPATGAGEAPSRPPGTPFRFGVCAGCSLGGVRELFFRAAGSGRGIIRRVTTPCPVVQRFVVSQ